MIVEAPLHCSLGSNVARGEQSPGLSADWGQQLPHTPVSEHRLPDFDVYVSSPSSLFLYEQEQSDIQSFYTSWSSLEEKSVSSTSQCSEVSSQDLHPCYECSQPLIVTSAKNDGAGGSPWVNGSLNRPVNVKNAFQVSERDVNSGPTLAALNSAEDSAIGYDFEDIESIIKEELGESLNSVVTERQTCTIQDTKSPAVVGPSVRCEVTRGQSVYDASLNELLTAGKLTSATSTDPTSVSPSCAIKTRPRIVDDFDPATPNTTADRSNDSFEKKWEDVRHKIFDESSAGSLKIVECVKSDPSYLEEDIKDRHSTGYLSNMDEESDDEYFGTEEESYSDDSDDGPPSSRHRSLLDQHREGYFWQYNTQSKGPKGKRLAQPVHPSDPHVLSEFRDPVFNPGQVIELSGIRHGGKARRGDGNDVSPNPRKLNQLGNELRKLNKQINDMLPTSELPLHVRNKTRKEKNKLASRACRLKKKANHEANKVKLFGLNCEHRSLMKVLTALQTIIQQRLGDPASNDRESLSRSLQKLVKGHLANKVAGHTTEFVNRVIENVGGGDFSGGLDF